MANPIQPDLATLQRWLQELVLHEVDTRAAAEQSNLIPADAVAHGDLIPPVEGLDPFDRAQVYNGGYVSRLVGVLETDYKATRCALGNRWRAVAMAAVYANPSREPNLNPYGRMLPPYLATRDDLPDRAFLADLARIEWAMTEAFDAPEFVPFDMATAQHQSEAAWATATFEPNPSLRVLDFDHPVNTYVRAILADESPQPAEPPGSPEPQPTATAVYRKDQTVWRLDLPLEVAAILRALADGTPFGEALAVGQAKAPPDQPIDVGKWFREWAADGLFVDVVFAT